MKFITNYPIEGEGGTDYDPRQGGPRDIHLHEKNRTPDVRVRYCERNGEGDYTEIGSDEFLKNLRGELTEEVLIYIHGFNNQPEKDVFPRAEALQSLVNSQLGGQKSVEVIVLLWPCDDDFGVTLDYWDDQEASQMSGHSFYRVLTRFMVHRDRVSADDECYRPINILSHSMGNRLLRFALENYNSKNGNLPALFRNIFMVAADIENRALEEGRSGYAITQVARNVVSYFANDDLAMTASKIANVKNKVLSRRLGHTGPKDMGKVEKNVYSVDCDDVNNSYDKPKGHSYFLDNGENDDVPGGVLKHIALTIKTGRVGGHARAGNREQVIEG